MASQGTQKQKDEPQHGDDSPVSARSTRRVNSAVIPVIHEQATVAKRVVETGKVRIAKRVREYEEIVDIPHLQEEVKVQRVAVGRFVDASPGVRTEGETTIVPVLQERYVLEKRLYVVEELHITKERHETHNPQKVRVLKEEVEVERLLPGEAKSRDRQTSDRGSKQRRREK